MRFSRIAYGVLLLVALTACGTAAPDQTGSSSVSSSEPSAAPSVPSDPSPVTDPSPAASANSDSQATTAAQEDQMLAVFTRSGGLAGRTQTLMVQRDGTIVVRGEDGAGGGLQTAQVDPAMIATLEAAVNSDAWQQLDAQYGRQVPDGFAYTIAAGGKQVQTYDGATNPPILDSVIGQMNELLAAAAGRE